MSLPNYTAELGERVISALHRENVGSPYKRSGYIADLAMEAKIDAATKPVDVCPFNNEYGFCKLDYGHEGSHTVIFLGKDD